MNLGIMVDSSCGLTKEEVEKRGWIFLPLFMSIDNKNYADGKDISPKEYYDTIKLDMEVKTSATPPGIIEETVENALKKFDKLIIYPLSKGLSSQVNTIKMITKDMKNVHVVNSEGVGHGIVINCLDIENFAKIAKTFDEIIEFSDHLIKSQYGFAIPETMDWLVKGGRASKSAAALANILKIIPIISFENGLLDKGGKGRVFNKVFLKTSKKIFEDKKTNGYSYIVLSAGNEKAEMLTKKLEEIIGIKLEIHYFPPVIANHIGKGALAFMRVKRA